MPPRLHDPVDYSIPMSASRSPSPRSASPSSESESGEPSGSQLPLNNSATCQWDNCGMVFTHLPSLISHLNDDHVGMVAKRSYSCEWTGCNRAGLAQTSRFALVSHIRSHTGEKPFICSRPECDKAFTRSDALAKHNRLQHKQKSSREDLEESTSRAGSAGPHQQPAGSIYKKSYVPYNWNSNSGHIHAAAMHASNGAGFSSFKLEPADEPLGHNNANNGDTNGRSSRDANGHSGSAFAVRPQSPMVVDPESDSDDELPPHLRAQIDPETNLIMGRSPTMVKYLLMKAKHKYALQEHEHLIEELRVARTSLTGWKDEKEKALDQVLFATFGPEANNIIEPTRPPPGYHRTSRSPTRY